MFVLMRCADGIQHGGPGWARSAPPILSTPGTATSLAPGPEVAEAREQRGLLMALLMPRNVLGETRKEAFQMRHNQDHAARVKFGEDTC